MIMLTWVDAQTIGGPEWMEISDSKEMAKLDLPTMNSVGFLLHEDANQYVLSCTVGPNETSQIHKIPKCMVLSFRHLH